MTDKEQEDIKRLDELGFITNNDTVEDSDWFLSFRFGSC